MLNILHFKDDKIVLGTLKFYTYLQFNNAHYSCMLTKEKNILAQIILLTKSPSYEISNKSIEMLILLPRFVSLPDINNR